MLLKCQHPLHLLVEFDNAIVNWRVDEDYSLDLNDSSHKQAHKEACEYRTFDFQAISNGCQMYQVFSWMVGRTWDYVS
jgi:hypothetical protein